MGQIGPSTPTAGDRAARQGAWLFLVAGALALLAIVVGSPRPGVLVVVAVADLATAALCLLLPWGRWPVTRIAWLSLIAFLVLGVSTWAFGGQPGGTIPFYVLTFAWLGLHQPPRLVVWAAAPAAVSYLAGLAAAGAAPEVLGGSLVLVPVLVAVGYVIARTMDDLRQSQLRLQAQEQWRAAMTATLAHDVRSPQGLTVLADRGRLEQILVNLTNNAVRHGGGPVLLGAERVPGAVVLSVRDHGPGVAPEATSRLFTRLADGRPGTDSVGLGLWIVRMLTEAHGGSVSQENATRGAVFRVRLPQPEPEPARPR